MTGESSSHSLNKLMRPWLPNIAINDNAPAVDERLGKLIGYSHVPKGPWENLQYRRKLVEMAMQSPSMQQELWILCRRDILFFINSFLYVFEPRRPAVLPFITWDFQDRAILLMDQFVGKRDIGLEKSRDMGATWIYLTVFFHRWLFFPRQTFGLVSRTEDLVDSKDDPDCLMWKIDFHLENLPDWMRPPTTRVRLNIKNEANNSIISGYSATQDVGRGGRKTAFGMDELAAFAVNDGFNAWASTQHVTDCRIMVSTPKGKAGIFAEQMLSRDVSMVKISMHWSQHPMKRRGLYRATNEELERIDKTYTFPSDYDFVLDGKLRSPWYDEECRRHPIPALIAQELDIDYAGSGFPFYDAGMIQAHAQTYAMEPFMRGELDFDRESHDPKWAEHSHGRLRLWINLTADDEPPHNHDYIIGCDIATGKGGDQSTNSVASIMNKTTREKVGEMAIGNQTPEEFADTVMALRKWFRGPSGIAFLIWEDNGPGGQFARRMLSLAGGMARIYWRETEKVVTGKVTKYPGYYTNRDNKRLLLGEYGRAIREAEMVNRSHPALEEMLHYRHMPNGSVEHDRSQATLDPTAAGANHGDRVIADALLWKAVGAIRVEDRKSDTTPKKPPYGSMAWRFEQENVFQTQAREEAWM